MAGIRTTITLDPDVYSMIQRRLDVPGASLKSVVNDAIRSGLAPRRRQTFRTKTADMGQPLVSLDHALRLAGDLDDALMLRTMEMDA